MEPVGSTTAELGDLMLAWGLSTEALFVTHPAGNYGKVWQQWLYL